MCRTRSSWSRAAPNTTPPSSRIYSASRGNTPPAVDAWRTEASGFQAANTAGSGRGSRCFRTGQMWAQWPHWMQASVTVGYRNPSRSGSIWMAPLGQPLAQAPQPVHLPRSGSREVG